MDEIPTTPTPAPQSELSELQAECLWLRRQIQTILILAIIVSGTLCLYLWRQVRYTRSDLNNIRPQAQQIIAEYTQASGPNMDEFVRSVATYGRTHADFAPIMAKYRLESATNFATPPPPPRPAAVPAPAAAPAPKK